VHLEDVNRDPPDQYTLQLLEELSVAVQQMSSDQLEKRDAMDFVWTKFQLEQNQRLVVIEQSCNSQLDALKDMAIEFDLKLNEVNTQLVQVNEDITADKTSMSTFNTEVSNKAEQLTNQLEQLQQTVQRYADYNRRTNGQRLVHKREQELQIQKLHQIVEKLTRDVHNQAEQISTIQSTYTSTPRLTIGENLSATPSPPTGNACPDSTDECDDSVVDKVDTENYRHFVLRPSSSWSNDDIPQNHMMKGSVLPVVRCRSF
jgi:hypothetical protein